MTGRRPGLGIALMLAMTVVFASMDSTIRYLGAFVPVLVILWARYTTQAVAMGVWLVRSRERSFRTAHPRFQLLRGLLLLATSAMSFYGVQYMPVPEFTAINMLTPVVVTLLAAWLLHEPVSRLRWALVCGGFVGALIVIRPGSGLFGWAVVFPLAGALTYASFQVLTSKLSTTTESPYTTHFYTGLVGTLVLTPLVLLLIDLPAVWAQATASQVALLLLIGAFGTVGHLLLILALGMAPTSTLMPFIYVQIGVAAVIGWFLFRTVPDTWGWIGMAVIAACGATSAWLNVRAARVPAARVPATAVVADTIAD